MTTAVSRLPRMRLRSAAAARGDHHWSRIACAVLFASLTVLVLGTRTHTGFERIRIPVPPPSSSAISWSIDIPLPDVTPLHGSTAVIILWVHGAPGPTRMQIVVDGVPVHAFDVTIRDRQRVSAAVDVPPRGLREITVSADRPGWQLESIELSNAHGFSRGLVSFVILPRAHGSDRAMPWWLLAVIAAGLLALRPRLDWPHTWAARILLRLAAAMVLLFFAAVLMAELVSPYALRVSLGTVGLFAAVLYAEAVARMWRLRYAPHLVLVCLVLWGVARTYDPAAGFTRLIAFGAAFHEQALPEVRALPVALDSPWGYDGQFYAQLALDPLVRSEAIITALDSPSYRSRRILFSWVAYVGGLGQPWLVLHAYALLNVVCWLLLAWLLLRWLPPDTPRLTAAWAACLLGHGMLTSMRMALPDGPSMLLLAVGVAAAESNRRWLAAGVLGAGGLGRETNVLGGVILPTPRGTRAADHLCRVAGPALLVIAPLAVWLLYLWSIGLAGGSLGERAFSLPFVAVADKWLTTGAELAAQGWSSQTGASLLTLVALTTQALVLVWRRDPHSLWWRMGAAYVVLMLVIGDAVWEGHPAAVTRVVLPMTVAFNVLLPRGRWFWPLLVLGNANLAAAVQLLPVPVLADIL